MVFYHSILEPHGMTFDGEYFWIANAACNVYGYDFDGNQVGSFSTPEYSWILITLDVEYFIINDASEWDGDYPYYKIDYELYRLFLLCLQQVYMIESRLH